MKKLLSVAFCTFLLFGCGAGNDVVEEDAQDIENETIVDDTDETAEIDQQDVNEFENIREFELDIDLDNNDEIDMEYKNINGDATAEVERKTADGKEETKGEEAINEIQELLLQTSIDPNTSAEDAIDQLLAALNISRETVTKLELEIDFITGEKIKGNL